MKLGYARVSTDEQTLTSQCQRLSAAGCEKLFEEKISGAVRNRPKLEKLLDQLRKGDVLVVTRLDRLARSTSELLRIAERITEKSAGLQSLDEPWGNRGKTPGKQVQHWHETGMTGPKSGHSTNGETALNRRCSDFARGFAPVTPWADTTSPSGRMIMTVFAGIAEFERTLILSRTQEGRLAAQARGVAFGRPKKMQPDQQELARDLVRDGKSISAVARTFKVHPATIYRVLER